MKKTPFALVLGFVISTNALVVLYSGDSDSAGGSASYQSFPTAVYQYYGPSNFTAVAALAVFATRG